MAHFPSLRSLISDMNRKHIDREHYSAKAQNTMFDVIICLDAIPHEILIGGQGINWACVLYMSEEFEITMSDNDFYSLREKLDIKKDGKQKFGSYIFLKEIFDQSPKHCSEKPVQPNIMQRWYRNRGMEIDTDEKDVFFRWRDQNKCGNQAQNFDKTEKYFGKNVADYCRRHNITSQWISKKKAERMNIVKVKYPWM